MIKKLIIFTFLMLVFSFSFAKELNANYKVVPVNLFNNMYEYTKENFNKSLTDAYKQAANEYGVSSYAIKKILNGDTFNCFRIFDKLGIKPDKDGNYKMEDFIACRENVKDLVDNYFSSAIVKKSVDDSLKGENFLADGDEENSSYDLLIDFKYLTEILFKEKIVLNTKFDLLARRGSGRGSSGGGNYVSSLSNQITIDNGPYINSNSNNGSLGLNGSVNNVLNLTDKNNTISDNNGYSDNFNNQSENSLLSNIPLGSNCGNNGSNINGDLQNGYLNQNNLGNQQNNLQNSDTNQSNFEKQNNNLTNMEENYDNHLFPIEEGEVPVGLEDVGLSYNELSNGADSNKNGGAGGGNSSCPSDDLLSICVKLVPSGPRGPVGGTTRKRSIEEVIDKISDTLKYMRQTWIISAGHGDEALDIDFKHVSLPDIFAFNIILTPKPVFNFKKDKKVQKQANAADTELENVPRKLAKIYSDLNIVDGFNSHADFKKYLITNLDKIKPYRRVNLNYPEKITNDSASGIFDEAEKYTALLTNILNMLNAMEELTRNWIGSSIALEEKSTF